jgi:hypothetical protein
MFDLRKQGVERPGVPSMRNELRVRLVRKPTAANTTKKRELTGEEIRKALADRAGKILRGEDVEPVGWKLQSY